jgi:glutathione S-transferase
MSQSIACTLYGSYASYYTAKVRAYLRKKGIPFNERLPSDPRFREHVRPTSGSHRIPQLEMADGSVIQDSVAILDYLESRYPEIPAIPTTPRQRLAVHLMELLGSEGLARLAWQYRWFFEGNETFVKMDFGRSFRPQGSDEELLHYGNVIAERMLSRGQLDNTDAVRSAIKVEYVALLAKLEAHFTHHPYMLGGHPSAADYALMGALHAHMGRDPEPLRVMQDHGPRTFRFMEHMLVPEIQSPEFFDVPIAYPENDQLPETFVAILGHLGERYGHQFEQNACAWAAHATSRQNEATGTPLTEPGDQPVLPAIAFTSPEGKSMEAPCNLYHAWVSQRAQTCYAGLAPADRSGCDDYLDAAGLGGLVRVDPVRLIERQEGRLCLGAPTESEAT